jgi:hypothetical protein
VVLLGEERKAVLRGWQEKGDWLRQVSPPFLSLRESLVSVQLSAQLSPFVDDSVKRSPEQ